MERTIVLETLGGEKLSVALHAGNRDRRNRDDFKVASNCCKAEREQKYLCKGCQKDITGEKSEMKILKVGKKETKLVPVSRLKEIDERLESIGEIALRKQVSPPADIADWYDKVLYAEPAEGKTGPAEYAKLARLLKGRWMEGSVIYHKNGYRVLASSDGVVVRFWLLVDSEQRKSPDIEALSGIVAKAKVDEEELALMQDILAKQESELFNPDDGFRDARLEEQEALIERVITGDEPMPTAMAKVEEEKRNEKLARLRALAGK